ncbi:MAG: MBL fold metallo-hydrolase [Kiritimatiellia bacterium]|jgi:hydroxyacylglutathione hydrolase
MNVHVIETGAFAANCHLIWADPGQTLVVDPGADAEMIERALAARGLTPCGYLLTHGHLDHISAIATLAGRLPAPIHLSAEDAAWAFSPINAIPPYAPVLAPPPGLDTDLHDGRVIDAGPLRARVVRTPGHTPGCVCFAFDDEKTLVSGDTLFRGSIGRTDLPGGSIARIRESLAKLMRFDDDVNVLPGHGPATSIGAERRSNPFIAEFGDGGCI